MAAASGWLVAVLADDGRWVLDRGDRTPVQRRRAVGRAGRLRERGVDVRVVPAGGEAARWCRAAADRVRVTGEDVEVAI